MVLAACMCMFCRILLEPKIIYQDGAPFHWIAKVFLFCQPHWLLELIISAQLAETDGKCPLVFRKGEFNELIDTPEPNFAWKDLHFKFSKNHCCRKFFFVDQWLSSLNENWVKPVAQNHEDNKSLKEQILSSLELFSLMRLDSIAI